jgi:hypothetical protein
MEVVAIFNACASLSGFSQGTIARNLIPAIFPNRFMDKIVPPNF